MKNNTRRGGAPTGPADRNPVSNRFCRLWTTVETAEFLGCTPRHLFNLRSRGELEPMGSKLGKVMYWPGDVLDFVGIPLDEAIKVAEFGTRSGVAA